MRRVYRREWFGIPFSSFSRGSSRELADGTFYEAFYQPFFSAIGPWKTWNPVGGNTGGPWPGFSRTGLPRRKPRR